MKQYSPVVRLMSVFSLAALMLTSCKKVNEATELGGDLIPVVDNINTFDTTLEVEAYNYPFTTEDSSRSLSTNVQWLGKISNDPLFGRTTASLFFQLTPTVYKTPFAFTDKNNLIAIDSIVMVLGYRTAYGDTTLPQQVQVFELDLNNDFKGERDTAYMIRENNLTYSNPLSNVKFFTPSELNDSVKLFREAAINQLRIPLDNNFGLKLLRDFDSTNAYLSDSAFKTAFKGFAVVPGNNGNGNALMGFSLADTNTKLAIYYRYNKAANTPDTAVTYFRFASGSANANYVQRDRSGSEFASVAGDNNPDALVYIQNTPGTFATVKIPALATLTNRVVHRAELIMEQVPDAPLSTRLTPPSYLYLDAYDASARLYRTIPFDVAFNSTGQVNAVPFGMIGEKGQDAQGNPILRWRLNLSRYVQNVVNKVVPAYDFRLYSPYVVRSTIGTSSTVQSFSVNPTYGIGRVRVGGGNHPTQKMRMRIVYSKL